MKKTKSHYRQTKNLCAHLLFPKYFVKQFQIYKFAFQRDIVNETFRNVGVICWTCMKKVKGNTKDRLCVCPVGFFFDAHVLESAALSSSSISMKLMKTVSVVFVVCSCDKTFITKVRMYH